MQEARRRPSVGSVRYWRQRLGARRRRRELRRNRSRLRRLGVPILAVTGTNGKTTVATLLERLLRSAGYRVGLACTDGVTRDGAWVARGDQAWARGLWRAAGGGGVDALVAETARGGIVRYGIGFARCRVAVVTNLFEDHLGVDGIQSLDEMARVKARVVERLAADGTAVLNADDSRVAAMAGRAPGAVILFSMREGDPPPGPGLFLRDGWIHQRRDGVEAPRIAVDDVALGRGGLLPYNLAHVMAALGALEGVRDALPVPEPVVQEVLRRFGAEPGDGRFNLNLVAFRGVHLLLCSGKNPAGYRADLAALREIRAGGGYRAVIGLITHVGDRSADFHRRLAGLASEACDRLVAVPPEDRYLRGQSRESLVARLEAGIPAEKRLPWEGGDWRAALPRLRRAHPEPALFVLFEPREQPGVDELLQEGRSLPLLPGPR